MRMKHRSTGVLLLGAALTLAACAPPNQGAGDESAEPSPEATEAAPGASDAASPTESPYTIDEY
jgi:hypothetical protein